MRPNSSTQPPKNAPRAAQRRLRGAFFARFAALAPSRGVRLAFFLFALLQVVAPLWHVCEMGGQCHDGQCHPKTALTAGTAETGAPEAKTLKAWKPKCGGGALCPCKQPPGTLYSPSGQFYEGRPGAFEGTCLARELMGMGRVAIAPLTLQFVVTSLRLPRPADIPAHDVPSLTFAPSRGPPVF